MANEISSADSLSVTKNGATIVISTTTQRTLTGVGIHMQELTISNAVAEQLTWPADLTTEGITEIQIKNLDPTNFVRIAGTVDGTPALTGLTLKILPLQSIKFAPTSDNPTLHVQASTAPCDIMVAAVGT